ncbi:MAG TPA: MATE family efflux transporter [Blastocatellia bacterium]|nr:MATE family efflux transporter [Blastocatellia bacterium]
MNEQIEIRTNTLPSNASGLWASVREALLGSGQDFTEGGIGRAIFLLSVPMVLEMMLESLFGIVNVFWVARLGADAMASVAITESVLTVVFTVALGLSMAATATVARRTGEKDAAGASHAAAQSILLGVIASLPIALVGLFGTRLIFQLMGAKSGVMETGLGYGTIILAGNATIMLLFLINAVFRGAGDAATAMRSLWFANIANIILDPLFIFGVGPFPKWGVTGSAVATTIGRGAGVVFQLWMLLGSHGRVKVKLSEFRPDWKLMWKLLRLSLGGMFQYGVATASWLALTRLIAEFGSAALAGYNVALRIIIFAILPSWGMSNAAATLVGQNLGAGKPDRAEKSVWRAGLANMVFLGFVAVVFVALAEPLIRIFTDDPAVIPYGVSCLRWVSYGYIFYAWGMVMVQSFNGAGDTYTPTVINLFCYWLFQIPLAWTLAMKTQMGADGVFAAIPIAESLLAVVGMLAFRRGTWKERKV